MMPVYQPPTSDYPLPGYPQTFSAIPEGMNTGSPY